jgi:hypothetical protein
MQNKSSKKTLIIIIIVVVLAVLGYFYFMGGQTPVQSDTLSENVSPELSATSQRVLSLLSQVQSLRIEAELFKSPLFRSFEDHSVPIPSQEVGRQDPFAPIPGVSNPGSEVKK